MAWYIESYQELGRHPKVTRLSNILSISKVQSVGHLHYLWWWAMDFALDGDLSRFSYEEIADGAMWEGDATTFIDALIESRFLDTEPLTIHDWSEYGGALIQRRKADAKRKSEERKRKREGCPADVQRTSTVCTEDVLVSEVKLSESKRSESAPARATSPTLADCEKWMGRFGGTSQQAEKMFWHYEAKGWPSNGLGIRIDALVKKWLLGDAERCLTDSRASLRPNGPTVPPPVDPNTTDPEILRLLAVQKQFGDSQ